jgi:ABC-type branched-subunit amino acid transport system substrate-binding protein
VTAFAAATAVLLGGCSPLTGDAGDAVGAGGSSCVSPGVTADNVQLGLITPSDGMSGPAYLSFRGGVDARIGVENSRGGVGGRKIGYVWGDDESNPATNLAVARDLVREGVFGMIQGSTASAGSADYLRAQGVPVTGTATDPVWSDHANMISYSNLVGPGPTITTWGDFVRDKRGTVAAVLAVQSLSASVRLAERMRSSLLARGVKVPVFTEISQQDPEMVDPELDGVVERMSDAGVDTIVATLDNATLSKLVTKARKVDLKLRVVLSPSTYDEAVLRQYGRALAGSYSFLTVQPFEARLPAHRSFLDGMAQYAPQIQPASQHVALTGWIAADMFIRALSAAPACPMRDAALNGIRSIRDYDAGGLLLRSVSLAAKPSEPDTCFAFVQLDADGSGFTPVKPKPRCGDLLTP